MNIKYLVRMFAVSAALLGVSAAGATDILYRELAALDIDYTGGVMTLNIKTYAAMSPGVPNNTDNYTPVGNAIVVPIANTYLVPNTANWDCLGRNTTVYRLLQTDAGPTKPWVGWNTQDVAGGALFIGGKVQLEIVSLVSAPLGANMAFYTTSAAGVPTPKLNTRAGACSMLSYGGGAGLPVGGQGKGFWSFTHPGTYVIRFKASGMLSAGGTVTSGNVDYTFEVQ
jgi:surface-anchored protein